MSFFRQIIGDRMSGGALAVLISVLIVLQGLIADRTMAAMETMGGMGPGHGQIICGPHGLEAAPQFDHDHPEGKTPAGQSRRDCCLAACQIVQGFVAGLAVTFVVLADGWPQSDAAGILPLRQTHLIPRSVSVALGARGPPLFAPV